MSAALWNSLMPWRGPLERLLADTRLPIELVQFAMSERSVATLSATFALISFVISVMLFRAQGKSAHAKFNKRVRAAMSYAPNSKDDLQKIAQSNVPYPYLLAAPVCLGCALVYAYFGFKSMFQSHSSSKRASLYASFSALQIYPNYLKFSLLRSMRRTATHWPLSLPPSFLEWKSWCFDTVALPAFSTLDSCWEYCWWCCVFEFLESGCTLAW
jgi:hypothetical protein